MQLEVGDTFLLKNGEVLFVGRIHAKLSVTFVKNENQMYKLRDRKFLGRKFHNWILENKLVLIDRSSVEYKYGKRLLTERCRA